MDPRVLALAVATLLLGGAIGILVAARVFPTRIVKTRTVADNVTHTETVIRLVGSPRPRTLANLRGYISAFAADAGWLVWVSEPPLGAPHGCRLGIHVLELSSGRTAAVDRNSCRYQGERAGLALVGDRVLWTQWEGGNTEMLGEVLTAALGDRRTRVLASFHYTGCEDDPGCAPPVFGSDGRSAVFSIDGGVDRLAGRDAKVLFRGAGYGYRVLAVGGSRVAAVTPAVEPDPNAPTGYPGASLGTAPSIEIHAWRGGALLRTLEIASEPYALALSSTHLVTLRYSDTQRPVLDGYDVQSGRRLWTLNGPLVRGMAIVRRWLVVALGQRLVLLDLATGRTTPFLRADGQILGVDAAAGRAVWAEQVGDHRVRIRSVAVPG